MPFLFAPMMSTMTAVVQSIPDARVVAVARAALPKAVPGTSRTISVIGHPGVVRVPSGTLSIKAQNVEGRWPRARVAVPVRIRVNGKPAAQVTVWFAVREEAQALVFDQDEPKGTPVDRIHAHDRNVDLARARTAPVVTLNSLHGMRLKRAVLAGMPVVQGDFEVTPLVDTQANVDVKVNYGPIHMNAQGTALASGEAGDVIPVLVNGATSPVRARIEARGVVDVIH